MDWKVYMTDQERLTALEMRIAQLTARIAQLEAAKMEIVVQEERGVPTHYKFMVSASVGGGDSFNRFKPNKS